MKTISKLKFKNIFLMLNLLFLLTINNSISVFANEESGSGGKVSAAIENTWKDAAGQIKDICDKVVFPAIALVLAVLFFVKLATNYFDYKKHGSFEFTAPALLFLGLILALTAPLYVWNIIGI